MLKNRLFPDRPDRWWDWLASLLLIAAMLAAATRLNATHWTEDLHVVQTVTFLGAIAGLALGYSFFSVHTVRLFALIYGAFVVVWQVGLTMGKGILWQERLVSMSNRLLLILNDILRQKPVSDNLFFLLLMAVLFWMLSVYAGYSLTRHGNPWRGILPAGLALVIIHTYDSAINQRTWYLAAYIFLALLLVARMHYLRLYRRWKQFGTYLPPFMGFDSVRLGLVVTALVVLLAWTAPALASALPPVEQIWQRATAPWIIVRDRMSNAFASLQSSSGLTGDFFGDTLTLGRGNPLSDAVILAIQTDTRSNLSERYYWRSRVYDSYLGSWLDTSPGVQDVVPNSFNLTLPEYEGREIVSFAVKTSYPIQNLYAPAEPVWISRPVQAHFLRNPDGTADIRQLKATPYLRPGDVYEVRSSINTATIAQLREAGTEYPAWVTDHYLELPPSITQRTRDLASQVASSLETPYDQAQAITDYLRNNIEYNEIIPLPPAGQDAVDWFLFDFRQGFCNYYASAEVIMLRTLGIPARLAVGYAQGERHELRPGDPNEPQRSRSVDIFIVRQRDLHAWPEVYFPGIGWVEFEPTVSQEPIIRLSGTASNSDNANPPGTLPILEDELPQRNEQDIPPVSTNVDTFGLEDIPAVIWYILAALVILGIVAATWQVRKKRGSPPIPVQLEAGLKRLGIQSPPVLRRWAYAALLSPMARAYRELNRALARLGNPPAPTNTPAERGEALSSLLPMAIIPINNLLDEYQVDIYGNQSGNPQIAYDAGLEIRKYSYQSWMQSVLDRYLPLRRKKRRKKVV